MVVWSKFRDAVYRAAAAQDDCMKRIKEIGIPDGVLVFDWKDAKCKAWRFESDDEREDYDEELFNHQKALLPEHAFLGAPSIIRHVRTDEYAYIMMEAIQGKPLSEILREAERKATKAYREMTKNEEVGITPPSQRRLLQHSIRKARRSSTSPRAILSPAAEQPAHRISALMPSGSSFESPARRPIPMEVSPEQVSPYASLLQATQATDEATAPQENEIFEQVEEKLTRLFESMCTSGFFQVATYSSIQMAIFESSTLDCAMFTIPRMARRKQNLPSNVSVIVS